MPVPNTKFDRDALHAYLYRKSDRLHRIVLNQKKMAEQLEVSYYNFTVIIRGMAEEGRLRQIGGSKFGSKTYLVEDPTSWRGQ
jgi:hypothetical protein